MIVNLVVPNEQVRSSYWELIKTIEFNVLGEMEWIFSFVWNFRPVFSQNQGRH